MASRDLSAFRAASRFGLGGSRKDLAAIGGSPLDWIERQLGDGASVVMSGVPPIEGRVVEFQQYLKATLQRTAKTDADAAAISRAQQAYRDESIALVSEQTIRRFRQAVATDYPVKERLALFWSNHFTVSQQGKPQLSGMCLAFENEAIRPTLDRHFAHMLLRVATNPAMQLYLDNAQSIGPTSTIGRRRRLGLNENYAREVLELHTLGVDGGYTQEDVKALASILTGWTVGNDALARLGAKPGEFAFVGMMHEPGTHRLLGTDYKNGGRDQGIEALRDLAIHPATARHIATKLVRHFVSDEPQARDIDYVADVFRKTDGHLPSVHKAVITLSSAWDEGNRKLKTPYEQLVSTFRGLGLPVRAPGPILGSLRLASHFPFSAPSPAGWPDTAEHWGSPAILKQRVEFGVAAGQLAGNVINPLDAAQYLVDPKSAEHLIASIERAASPAQGMSLLLSSPDFQWR